MMQIVAILILSVVAMVVGAVWYGPVFGKKWMRLIGVDASDKKAVARMQKSAGPLYGIQFAMTLVQVGLLSWLVSQVGGVGAVVIAVVAWMAFVVPSLAGAIMWTSEKRKDQKERLMIQAGYQLVIFIIFGIGLALL